jgi:hypothetical protein
MKNRFIGIGVLVVLGISGIAASDDPAPSGAAPPAPVKAPPRVKSGKAKQMTPIVVPPFRVPTKEEVARKTAEIADRFRYKGTRVIPDKKLNAQDPQMKAVSAMLSKADYIPEVRVRRFTGFGPLSRPDVVVVGWHLTVEELEVRQNDSLIRVRVAPLLQGTGGTIGMYVDYHEDYRLAGGQLQFLGADPVTGKLKGMCGEG